MRNKNGTYSILISCMIAALLVAGPAGADITTFSAQLSGGNEIPPVMTDATGIATVVVVTDDEGQSYSETWTVEFSGLSGLPTTGSGFYDGSPLENGALWFEIGIGMGSPQTGPLPVDIMHALQFAMMVGNPGTPGNIYVNICTAEYPAGEIRGNFQFFSAVPAEETTWGGIKALYR